MKKTFKIKNSLRIPMVISILLSFPVFFDVFKKGISKQHFVLVGILVTIFFIFVINTLLRKIIFEDGSITIRNITGKKLLLLKDISLLDGISLGRRQYITISYKSRTHLIPNSFTGFTEIVSSFMDLFPENKVGQGLLEIQNRPLSRTGDTIAAWFTVIILAVIIFLRFFSGVVV